MPSRKPDRMLTMYLEYDDCQIPYDIIFSDRKTMAVLVTRTGGVLVKAPEGLPIPQIREFVKKHQDWIVKQLNVVKQQMEHRIVMTEKEIILHQELAKKVFMEKTAYWAKKMGVTYEKITVRSQVSRWGSCSSKGNLSFNWRVVLMPPQIQDYVVVHELAHRIEMNHSERFWNQVKTYLPEYKNYRIWLRCHGGEYDVFSEH